MPYATDSLPTCPDCGKRLSKKTSAYCVKHAARHAADKKPKAEPKKRIRGVCIDCGDGVTGQKSKRCLPCRRKFEQGNTKPRHEYARNWALQKKYGIDNDGFEAIWNAFRGQCGICSKELTMPEQKRGQRPSAAVIDHDHNTGNIRGLLCNSCNKAIGLLKDNADLVQKAADYLRKK
jgi:hypothetical protein